MNPWPTKSGRMIQQEGNHLQNQKVTGSKLRPTTDLLHKFFQLIVLYPVSFIFLKIVHYSPSETNIKPQSHLGLYYPLRSQHSGSHQILLNYF